MQLAVGDLQLMVDADGATEFKELQKLLKKVRIGVMKMDEHVRSSGDRLAMIAGSRHHLTTD